MKTDRIENPRRTAFALGVALLACALQFVAFPASAQTQRAGGGGGASSQIMQQYQQLASERTALQAENTKLKADLQAMTSERDGLRKERDALRGKAAPPDASAQVAAATRAAQESLEQQRHKLEELVQRYRETATVLSSTERSRDEALALAAKSGQQLGECATRNQQLASLTDEVIQRYERQGWFHRATIDEPFTRITRARVQDLADADRARANELKVSLPDAPPPGVQPAELR